MIIFDLDGTLWNTILATEKAYIDIANTYKINDYDISCVRKGMGLNKTENLSNYYPKFSKRKAKKYLECVNSKTREYIIDENVKIYDGVREVIRELSKKYKLGIVTNNNNEYIKKFFDISKLEECFSYYIGAGTYNLTKKDAIKKIASKGNELFTVYVGDIKKDMEAALEAGVEFIQVKYGFGNNFNYKYSIDDIRNLNKVIECITKRH